MSGPRVLHVNTDDHGGGAALVAADLVAGVRERGGSAWLAVGDARRGGPHTIAVPGEAGRSPWARALRRQALRLGPGPAARVARTLAEPVRTAKRLLGREDMAFPATAEIPRLPDLAPDVVHLHNLHGGYFDLRALPAMSAAVPTVLTLHDSWLMAGHCAHPLECERWRDACGACPHMDVPLPIARDATRANRALKASVFSACRLTVTAPSRWLLGRAEASLLAPAMERARVIPTGIDTDALAPGDRAAERAALGLPPDARIVLMAGRALGRNPWKDLAALERALARVAGPRDEVLLVALGDESGQERAAGAARVLPVPFTPDRERVTSFLRAADVVAHVATMDSYPTTVLEAMACGTPVVATAVGGIPEQIEDGLDGLLAAPGDDDALATAMRRALDNPQAAAERADRAVRTVRRRNGRQAVLDAWLDLYAELAGERR